ncbi:hypothetical protein PPTG_22847 [Phytophthora nicotianae INRA-310]|uniref:Uncharacterized protein n=1 Tax=Phytophthora nicotianae (strain INRA-310) TaxID=761204 RepID=W2QAI3_PHYN3|nr:hypothetical protein PPTG_22847 [Phytophthora nicotianae INRA-310]ETN09856.1 hypothetical protein PPTG_22847 [Phytophthora nicotianae INRA-310]
MRLGDDLHHHTVNEEITSNSSISSFRLIRPRLSMHCSLAASWRRAIHRIQRVNSLLDAFKHTGFAISEHRRKYSSTVSTKVNYLRARARWQQPRSPGAFYSRPRRIDR